ncbi:MAG: class I SAM-dependent methyltransferase, partial [Gammaproteobacteria bacterium]|nr:class I SAM-dependent methyltransferase [Gammaproteobacteria bacterium]
GLKTTLSMCRHLLTVIMPQCDHPQVISQRDSLLDWKTFEPEAIPTKTKLPYLDAFLQAVKRDFSQEKPPSIIDLGCGTGEITERILKCGFSMVGMDLNPQAISRARRSFESSASTAGARIRFCEGNIAIFPPPGLAEAPFCAAMCQLVISIIGDRDNRQNLLRNAYELLRPNGLLYLSASGVSADINPEYARLYEADFALTGERFTYLSRSVDGGILYTTHHFTEEELRTLLLSAGFVDIRIRKLKEKSSRRSDQSAYFYYCLCRKPPESSVHHQQFE